MVNNTFFKKLIISTLLVAVAGVAYVAIFLSGTIKKALAQSSEIRVSEKNTCSQHQTAGSNLEKQTPHFTGCNSLI